MKWSLVWHVYHNIINQDWLDSYLAVILADKVREYLYFLQYYFLWYFVFNFHCRLVDNDWCQCCSTLCTFANSPCRCMHKYRHQTKLEIKGCGMGPWLVLVSPCFRENVVATCKIGSFLCSLDNLLQENVIILFFGNQISKWHSFEKRAIFNLLFTFFSHQGKLQKFLQHITALYQKAVLQ